jgi:predicted phosphoadenosine phosphosulfate sulfurtransferase
MTPPNIPLIYRIWHLWLEPVCALNGARYLHFMPDIYHKYMPVTTTWSPKTQIIYDQLAATYLLFAFNQAITLRVVPDVKTWKVLILGMAMCDAGHIYASWAEMGTRETLSPGNWRSQDWVTMVLNILPFLLRVAFVLGVGLEGSKKGKKKA